MRMGISTKMRKNLDGDEMMIGKTNKKYRKSWVSLTVVNTLFISGLFSKHDRTKNELDELTKKIVNGDFDVTFSDELLKRNDSLGQLATSFNTMIPTLKDKTKIEQEIEDLTEVSNKIASGDPDAMISKELLSRNDRIGHLATSLNSMITTLKNSSKINESCIRGIPYPVFKTNQELIVTAMNHACIDVFGYSYDEVIGKMKIEDLVKTPKSEREPLIVSSIKNKKNFVVETIGIKKDGTEFPVSTGIGALLNNQGEPVGGFEVVQDLTVLKSLVEDVDRVANGDFTVNIDDELKQRNDQTGTLAKAMDKMITNFKEMISKIQENVDGVLEIVEKLSANTEQVNAASEQASSSVQEIAKGSQDLSRLSMNAKQNVDNLISMAKGVSNAATETAKKAMDVNKAAEAGGSAAAKASEKMNSIKDSVASSAMIIDELGGKSQQIHRVIEVINSISEQTNLLALNAAIEAARAGEAGRGFAVVADEVRKLAEESKNATKQIDTMVVEITETTNKAVTSMQQGTKDVAESSQVVNEALKSLENIVTKISDVTVQTEMISSSANQQLKEAENVQKSVDEVSAVSEESAAGAQEVSSSIEETTTSIEHISDMTQNLSQKSEGLRTVISFFKLDTTPKDKKAPSPSPSKSKEIDAIIKK